MLLTQHHQNAVEFRPHDQHDRGEIQPQKQYDHRAERAVNDGVAVYLDESLNKYETVFPACGSSNSAIELTIPELEKCSGYEKWVDVTKASC